MSQDMPRKCPEPETPPRYEIRVLYLHRRKAKERSDLNRIITRGIGYGTPLPTSPSPCMTSE